MNRSDNPHQSPASADDNQTRQSKANAKLEKKAKNIGNDAEKAILVGLIPILGLIFILRLVQWYQLRSRVEGNQAIDRRIRRKFMNGKTRLWIAVLLWPILAVAGTIFFIVT